MELRYTAHARRQIQRRQIAHAEIEAVVESGAARVGETAVEYDGVIRGRLARVVVVRNADPPLVITVHWLGRRER